MYYENGVEVRTQGENPFDANSTNNAMIEVVRKSDYDKLKEQLSWKVVSKDGYPTHNRAVAIYPCVQGHDFACYNDDFMCWDREDGDDVLCSLEEVEKWFEIPLPPKD